MGIDTTGSSGAILLYHLADHPEVQERLYEEICSVIGPSGRMTASALAKMRSHSVICLYQFKVIFQLETSCYYSDISKRAKLRASGCFLHYLAQAVD